MPEFSTVRLDRFFADQRPATPCLVLDLETVRAQYAALQRHSYELPLDLAIGDPVDFLSAGAYTASAAAVAFNGFPPLASYVA